MKRLTVLMMTLTLLVTLLFSGITGTASAHAATSEVYHQGPATTHAVLQARSHGVSLSAQYDSNDPSDSGCWNNAAIVNSGVSSVDGYIVYGYNWYSYSCHTNWVEITWSSGAAIQTQVGIDTVTGGNYYRQCYPTDCYSYYTGGLSPSWTDMVPGANTTYAHLKIRAAATGHVTEVFGWIPA